LADETDVMQALFEIESKGDTITFEEFWSVLSEFVEAEGMDSLIESSIMDSAVSTFSTFNASDLLSPDELALYREIFDKMNAFREDTISARVIMDGLQALTNHADLPAEPRVFFFHMIPSVQYHAEDTPSFDFERFVTVIQEAAIQTKEDLQDPAWESLSSMRLLNENLEHAFKAAHGQDPDAPRKESVDNTELHNFIRNLSSISMPDTSFEEGDQTIRIPAELVSDHGSSSSDDELAEKK